MHRDMVLATTAAEWDEVWAEYDATVPARPAVLPAPSPRPDIQPRSAGQRAARLVAFAACAMALGGSAWVGAHGAAVWQVAEAVERQDVAAIASRFDAVAVRAGMRDDLLRIAARQEGLDAAAYLGTMAEEMAEAWSSVGALSEIARVRGVAAGAAADGLAALRPAGLSAVEIPVRTAAGAATPLTLRLELRDAGLAPSWQITGVTVEDSAPAAAIPPRVSALRLAPG